ncbi:hypothetical protein [Breoghania sp.]|uniref:hypothetical protein n=1 Tax=Breoghania sp. TaxID=2065378 RepID=UPI002AAAADC8|nr:hypothetical protein [Breoghania sp.]
MRRFESPISPLRKLLSAFVLAHVFLALALRSSIPAGYMPDVPTQDGILPGFVICHASDPFAPLDNGSPNEGKRDCPFALINRLAMGIADAPQVIAVAHIQQDLPFVLPPQCLCERPTSASFLARGPPPFTNGKPTENA